MTIVRFLLYEIWVQQIETVPAAYSLISVYAAPFESSI